MPFTRVIVTATGSVAASQLKHDLSSDPSLEIITATSVAQLFDQITLARPNVVLLDTHLAGESTPQLVQGLAHQRHLPVVLRASADDHPDTLLDAMDAGALAITTKPSHPGQTAELNPTLIWTLRAAAGASIFNLINPPRFEPLAGSPTTSASIVALGAGFGALPALSGILTQLPSNCPAALVVVPLPGYLTAAWAKRIARRCSVRVKHAASGDAIVPGHVLIAPGDSHMLVRRSPVGYSVQIKDGPAVFHQKPSIELLFNSLAETNRLPIIAALLSGVGVDGITGLLNLRNAGARTIIQLPDTCVSSDAPMKADRCHAGEFVLPPSAISQKLLDLCAQTPMPRAA